MEEIGKRLALSKEVRLSGLRKRQISLFAKVDRLLHKDRPSVIDNHFRLKGTETAAFAAVPQMITIQALRDVRVRKPVVGKQGRHAKQFDPLVFFKLNMDIFRPCGIQTQTHVGGLVFPNFAGEYNRFRFAFRIIFLGALAALITMPTAVLPDILVRPFVFYFHIRIQLRQFSQDGMRRIPCRLKVQAVPLVVPRII